MPKSTFLLDIVDAQKGFMLPDYPLYVPEADRTIAPAETFLSSVPRGLFRAALVKRDLHFAGEYPLSPEAALFPSMHCGFGTDEAALAVDVGGYLADKAPTYIMNKNAFDMWGSNPTGVDRPRIAFASAAEEKAYDSLFHVRGLHDPDGRLGAGMPRDGFIDKMKADGVTTIVIFGHAADYCVRDAVAGYLARGFKVVLLLDLIRGISRDMATVVAQDFLAAFGSGQLTLTTSDQFLAAQRGA
jgi:nicotinamidase/pyrazinamidase